MAGLKSWFTISKVQQMSNREDIHVKALPDNSVSKKKTITRPRAVCPPKASAIIPVIH